MESSLHPLNRQRGVMLLEALISILIFSIGILAIVGLQASSIKMTSDAKYRSDANLLANRLIGRMWLASSSPTFANDFSTNGSEYQTWVDNDVAAALPIAGISNPAVTITQSGVAAAVTTYSTVTIDIYWQVPGEAVHRHNTHTQITN